VVVGSRNWITPPAEMEEIYFPQVDSIIDALHEQILPIANRKVVRNMSDGEFLRQSQKGV